MAQTKVTAAEKEDIGFSAYNNQPSGTAIPQTVFTKVQFNVENFDTHGWYDTALTANGSRFTPKQPGLYHLSSQVGLLSVSDTATVHLAIYKNGAAVHWFRGRQSGTGEYGAFISATVDANGTTDYFEIFAWTAGGATNVGGSNSNCWFTGHKV